MQNASLIQDYLRLRAASKVINGKLVKTLERKELKEAGRRLGLLKRGTLVFGARHEVDVLADLAIHDVRIRPGDPRNAVERWSEERGESGSPDEERFLDAMRRARFDLFKIEQCIPGQGVLLTSPLVPSPLLLMDLGLSHSAEAGMLIGARIMRIDIPGRSEGYWMSTGASLPVPPDAARAILLELDKRIATVRRRYPSATIEIPSAEVAELVLRACLKAEASSMVAYIDPPDTPPPRSSASFPPTPVGRNTPCPCDSGKKYKRCCGRSA
ncbi:MAG TPA: SEC-C metal-binding domain-containing protein [Polyangia bacterium]|jgi:hypothetical protein|nr:SEC-C metal-binding domain-containing protein [Polyangia bacterium]